MRPEEQFAEIRALLHAMTERENQMEIRFDKRMHEVDRRMARADERHDRAIERMNLAEQRMEKFDKRLEATRKLVEAGMKIVLQNNVELRERKRPQKLFLDALRRGGNGHGRPERN